MFDDFDWGKIVQGALTAIPQVYAAYRGNQVQQQGNQQAVQFANEAAARKEALIREAAAKSETASAPALQHFQAVMGQDPSKMTPQQQITLQDSQRELNNSNLPGRVGGRAFSRVFADSTNRIKAGAVNDNVARQDRAAGTVADITGRQGTNTINIAGTLANNVGGAADTAGNAAVSNATTTADTYGQIANFFANSMKDGDRASRYKDYKAGMTA